MKRALTFFLGLGSLPARKRVLRSRTLLYLLALSLVAMLPDLRPACAQDDWLDSFNVKTFRTDPDFKYVGSFMASLYYRECVMREVLGACAALLNSEDGVGNVDKQILANVRLKRGDIRFRQKEYCGALSDYRNAAELMPQKNIETKIAELVVKSSKSCPSQINQSANFETTKNFDERPIYFQTPRRSWLPDEIVLSLSATPHENVSHEEPDARKFHGSVEENSQRDTATATVVALRAPDFSNSKHPEVTPLTTTAEESISNSTRTIAKLSLPAIAPSSAGEAGHLLENSKTNLSILLDDYEVIETASLKQPLSDIKSPILRVMRRVVNEASTFVILFIFGTSLGMIAILMRGLNVSSGEAPKFSDDRRVRSDIAEDQTPPQNCVDRGCSLGDSGRDLISKNKEEVSGSLSEESVGEGTDLKSDSTPCEPNKAIAEPKRLAELALPTERQSAKQKSLISASHAMNSYPFCAEKDLGAISDGTGCLLFVDGDGALTRVLRSEGNTVVPGMSKERMLFISPGAPGLEGLLNLFSPPITVKDALEKRERFNAIFDLQALALEPILGSRFVHTNRVALRHFIKILHATKGASLNTFLNLLEQASLTGLLDEASLSDHDETVDFFQTNAESADFKLFRHEAREKLGKLLADSDFEFLTCPNRKGVRSLADHIGEKAAIIFTPEMLNFGVVKCAMLCRTFIALIAFERQKADRISGRKQMSLAFVAADRLVRGPISEIEKAFERVPRRAVSLNSTH